LLINLITFERMNKLTGDNWSQKDLRVMEWVLIELFAHRTMDKPITAKEIVKRKCKWHWSAISEGIKIFDYNITDVKVRAMVHALRHLGYPIGSKGNGYYWMHDANDVNVTLSHIEQRINSMNELKDDLIKIRFEIRNKGRAELEIPTDGEFTLDLFHT